VVGWQHYADYPKVIKDTALMSDGAHIAASTCGCSWGVAQVPSSAYLPNASTRVPPPMATPMATRTRDQIAPEAKTHTRPGPGMRGR
jgi:hypothetical protein